MTKTFGEMRKKTESTNIKILGGPLHVMYCIVVVTMLASGHDRYDSVDQWQSVHCESRRIELFTIFNASFSAAFDFRGFFSGTSSFYLKIDGTQCYRRQDTVMLYSKACPCKLFQRWNFVEAFDMPSKASNPPAFDQLVWSKHRTNLDL